MTELFRFLNLSIQVADLFPDDADRFQYSSERFGSLIAYLGTQFGNRL
jgi:hypothetical protein